VRSLYTEYEYFCSIDWIAFLFSYTAEEDWKRLFCIIGKERLRPVESLTSTISSIGSDKSVSFIKALVTTFEFEEAKRKLALFWGKISYETYFICDSYKAKSSLLDLACLFGQDIEVQKRAWPGLTLGLGTKRDKPGFPIDGKFSQSVCL